MTKKVKILIISIVSVLVVGAVLMIVLLNTKKYTDIFSAEELYSKVANSFSTDGGTKVLDPDVILEFSDDNLSYIESYIVVKAKNVKNINEIGIFKVDKGSVDDMEDIVENYVSNLQQVYRAMDYFPEEVEKIDCAKVEVFGNYVIYSFLNEQDTESFYSSIENVLQE